jgi:hypothetical protein
MVNNSSTKKSVRFSDRLRRHSKRKFICYDCKNCFFKGLQFNNPFKSTPKKLRKKRRNIFQLFNEPNDDNEPDLLISDGEAEEEDMADNVNRLIYYDPASPVENLMKEEY